MSNSTFCYQFLDALDSGLQLRMEHCLHRREFSQTKEPVDIKE